MSPNPEQDGGTSKKGLPFETKMKKVCTNCSESSIKVYVRNTLRLAKLVDPSAQHVPATGSFLEDPKIFKAFGKLNLNQRRLLSTAAVKSLDAFGMKRSGKWSKLLASAAEEYDRQREKGLRSTKEKQRWPTKGGYDALKRAAKLQKQLIPQQLAKEDKTLRDLWEIQKWLILTLYASHALRLDFADVHLERPSNDQKNYLFKYKRKGWILTLNVYKTAKFRGTQEIKMSRPASLVLSLVTPWIKKLTTHGKLLTNIVGGALSRNGLSKLLTRLTQRLLGKHGFSASLIRVLKATKFRKTLLKSKELSDEMLHSQKQNLAYSRKL